MLGLVGIPFILGLADWYAVHKRNRQWEYLFKPATLLVVIVWAILLAQARPTGWGWLAQFFVAGLAFSLAGDVFLLLPDQKRFFVPGLLAFLLAHVCYIFGLNATLPPAGALVLLLPVGALWVLLIRAIVAGLRAQGRTALVGPVAVYSVVISLMLFSAWATLFRPDWSLAAQVLVSVGATLFFVSDALNAWERFVTPMTHGRLYVMVTYHLAQFCLAATIAFAP